MQIKWLKTHHATNKSNNDIYLHLKRIFGNNFTSNVWETCLNP
jgi:hypothetical protein